MEAPLVGEKDSTCRESLTFGLELVRETRSKPQSAKSGGKDDSRKQATKMAHRTEGHTEAEKCDEPEQREPGKGNPCGDVPKRANAKMSQGGVGHERVTRTGRSERNPKNDGDEVKARADLA